MDRCDVAYKGFNDDLYYATNKPGTWLTILIDDGSLTEYFMDVDSLGIAHMIYYENNGEELRYVTIVDGTATYETLLTYVDARWDYIQVDEDDYLHSVWEFGWSGNYSNYTHNLNGDWETIDNALPGSPARFDIDNSDQLHFIFQMNWGLWYAVVPKGYVNP